MPLLIDHDVIRPAAERAKFRQLADHIRAAINSGELVPGESLPSEGELAVRSGLSKTAVVGALALLVAEGLIEKRPGLPSRVAIPAPVVHVGTARYRDEATLLAELDGREHPLSSAFTRDRGIPWEDYAVRADYREDVAGKRDAELLRCDVGMPVLRRRLVKLVRHPGQRQHRPVQLQHSTLPLAMVAGTPVADPGWQPWAGGTFAELASLGLVVTGSVEEVQARMTTVTEQVALELPALTVVLDVVRVFHGHHREDAGSGVAGPLEASRVIIPAPGVVLRYEIPID